MKSRWLAAVVLLLSTSLFPRPINAQYVDMSVYITGTSGADKWVYVAGECSGRGDTWVYLSGTSGADEWWYVTNSPSSADLTICLSGDLQEWFEQSR